MKYGINQKRLWTEADDLELVELRKTGMKVREIAKLIDRSTGGTESRIAYLLKIGKHGIERLPRQQFTPEHDRVITEMLAGGSTSQAIGEATGLKPEQVRGRVKVLGDRKALAESRNLESGDVLAKIQNRKVLDEKAALAFEKSRAVAEADGFEKWLKAEIRWCRRMSRRYGWSPQPQKKQEAVT